MRPGDRSLGASMLRILTEYHHDVRPMPGASTDERKQAFVEQLVESVRRVRYVEVLRGRRLSHRCIDPAEECFDPVKAAILEFRAGNVDEACWLVFLFVHFGKHRRGGWRYIRDIYGRLGTGRWAWDEVSNNLRGFRAWLRRHLDEIRRPGAGFGNHRKYESLNADSEAGAGSVVASYVHWATSQGGHARMFARAISDSNGDPGTAFHTLYKSMEVVKRFGRTARFDFLTMISKIGIADIRPSTAYLIGSTGPAAGAKLLFGDLPTGTLEAAVADLGRRFGVGMQVMEDALCNWQKSPEKFKAFRG